MQAKKFFAVFLIIFLGAFFCFTQEREKSKGEKFLKETSGEIQGKSLIRMDLLREKKEEPKSPKRNIFSPRSRYSPEVEPSPEVVRKKLEEIVSKVEENSPEILLELTYIGYINSGHKIIALIIFEEETLAVEEGEMIGQDIKVGKVSPQKIEIVGPDSKTREFSLEGD